QPDEDGLREGVEAPQDDSREGVSFWCLHNGDRQVTGGQEAHAATGSWLEVGGIPPPHVRGWSHRRLGLHRQERLLEAGRYQPGDLAGAADRSWTGSGVDDDDDDDDDEECGHEVQDVSTRRQLAGQRSRSELLRIGRLRTGHCAQVRPMARLVVT
ncbi:hypothetical protein HN011_012159, partial [Eciton burchellii]